MPPGDPRKIARPFLVYGHLRITSIGVRIEMDSPPLRKARISRLYGALILYFFARAPCTGRRSPLPTTRDLAQTGCHTLLRPARSRSGRSPPAVATCRLLPRQLPHASSSRPQRRCPRDQATLTSCASPPVLEGVSSTVDDFRNARGSSNRAAAPPDRRAASARATRQDRGREAHRGCTGKLCSAGILSNYSLDLTDV